MKKFHQIIRLSIIILSILCIIAIIALVASYRSFTDATFDFICLAVSVASVFIAIISQASSYSERKDLMRMIRDLDEIDSDIDTLDSEVDANAHMHRTLRTKVDELIDMNKRIYHKLQQEPHERPSAKSNHSSKTNKK